MVPLVDSRKQDIFFKRMKREKKMGKIIKQSKLRTNPEKGKVSAPAREIVIAGAIISAAKQAPKVANNEKIILPDSIAEKGIIATPGGEAATRIMPIRNDFSGINIKVSNKMSEPSSA